MKTKLEKLVKDKNWFVFMYSLLAIYGFIIGISIPKDSPFSITSYCIGVLIFIASSLNIYNSYLFRFKHEILVINFLYVLIGLIGTFRIMFLIIFHDSPYTISISILSYFMMGFCVSYRQSIAKENIRLLKKVKEELNERNL